jgi:hypothetical protein
MLKRKGMGQHLSSAKGPKPETPAWALALESLGWLIAGIAIIIAVLSVVPYLGEDYADARMMIVPMAAALASAGSFIGGIPIAIARRARRRVIPRRWRLWAAILIRFGGLLCVSFPLLIYGTLPAGLLVSQLRSSGDSSLAISPLDPALLKGTVALGGVPFAVGAILVGAAVIWGRRKAKPLSQDADVFS